MTKPMTGTAILKNIEAMERLANYLDTGFRIVKHFQGIDNAGTDELCDFMARNRRRAQDMLETIAERTHAAVMQEFEL